MTRFAQARIRKLSRLLPAAISVLLLSSPPMAALAQAGNDVETVDRPAWPSDGVAQRAFKGEQMFVEKIDGKWHAWVVSTEDTWEPDWRVATSTPRTGEALDFFSGERMLVFPGGDPDGRASPDFTTLKGVYHGETRWSGKAGGEVLKGLTNRYFSDLEFDVGFKNTARSRPKCPEFLPAVRKVDKVSGEEIWRKVVLYRYPPSAGCPNGSWESILLTALDLGDGTFLATTPEHVIRLSFEDLRPAGTVTNLYVVDTHILEDVLEEGYDPHALIDAVFGASGPFRQQERMDASGHE